MDGTAKEEEQDGMSVHSPCKAPPSSTSSLSKASLNVCIRVSVSFLSFFLFFFLFGVGGWGSLGFFVELGCLFVVKQEQSQVDLELRILEALEIYPLVKLQGKFVFFIFIV